MLAVGVVLAHVGGMPVEEVLSLAVTTGGMALVAVRVAWLRARSPAPPATDAPDTEHSRCR